MFMLNKIFESESESPVLSKAESHNEIHTEI